MKYARVVEQKNETINGTEVYYAFKTGKQGKKPAMICGHYSTRQDAEVAAKAYRSGRPASQLVLTQTKKLMNHFC